LIAFSASWLPESGWPIATALDRLMPFGCTHLEFNYRVHPLDPDVTRGALAERGLSVTSLHNICSAYRGEIPFDDRYGDSMADLDDDRRRAGAQRLRETADVARALGARAVVVHGGLVPPFEDSRVYHKALRQTERASDPSFVKKLLVEMLPDRNRIAPACLAQLIRSLREVCPDFPDLKFGLEIRYHFYGLPDFDELDTVLTEVGAPNVGYWHDCGHGQMQENLGLRRHEDWLRRYQDQLIGVHLHGITDCVRDHQAPEEDNMNFEMIRRYTGPDTLLLMELSPSNSVDAVMAGKAYLETLF
jgi:sugar phosphate isomerase/epimerase